MNQKDNAEAIARMENELDKLEGELQGRYRDMGKGLLELADQEQREIDRLVDEIVKTRKKLTRARHEIQCDECTAFNPPDSRYCRRCGAKLPMADNKKETENGTR
ncbi:zinc ribbon domain-containing protein [Clostridia bacterium OttesenSCG-928-O13]|nr:zinc ribbon domain-containing protein [Clostridia bacterium OttesenSCG-928-O13]